MSDSGSDSVVLVKVSVESSHVGGGESGASQSDRVPRVSSAMSTVDDSGSVVDGLPSLVASDDLVAIVGTLFGVSSASVTSSVSVSVESPRAGETGVSRGVRASVSVVVLGVSVVVVQSGASGVSVEDVSLVVVARATEVELLSEEKGSVGSVDDSSDVLVLVDSVGEDHERVVTQVEVIDVKVVDLSLDSSDVVVIAGSENDVGAVSESVGSVRVPVSVVVNCGGASAGGNDVDFVVELSDVTKVKVDGDGPSELSSDLESEMSVISGSSSVQVQVDDVESDGDLSVSSVSSVEVEGGVPLLVSVSLSVLPSGSSDDVDFSDY